MIIRNIQLSVCDALLACIITQPDQDSNKAVVLLHPHPLYGGNKDDQVVRSLDTVFLELGYTTLRFDFRGVSGGYARIAGAVEDTYKVIDLIEEYGFFTLGLAGYSFGASVALRVASSKSVSFLVVLSASLDLFLEDGYEEAFLRRINCPALLFHGTKDSVVPHSDMETFFSLITEVKAISLEDEDHFYQRRIPQVADEIRLFVSGLPLQRYP